MKPVLRHQLCSSQHKGLKRGACTWEARFKALANDKRGIDYATIVDSYMTSKDKRESVSLINNGIKALK